MAMATSATAKPTATDNAVQCEVILVSVLAGGASDLVMVDVRPLESLDERPEGNGYCFPLPCCPYRKHQKIANQAGSDEAQRNS